MQIANGIYMLELSIPVMGRIDVIHPTLLVDEGGAILVDTGYPGIFPLIQKAMEEHNVSISSFEDDYYYPSRYRSYREFT